MSDLNYLVTSALDSIENFPLLKEYRRQISDKKSHTFVGNLESFKASVYQGVKTQRSRGWSPTVKQDEELTKVITEYLSKMYSILSSDSSSKVFSYKFMGGTQTNFKALIVGNGVVFNHIKILRNQAGISKVSNTIKRLFNQTGKKTAVDVTHMESSTIAEQVATHMLAKFESVGNMPISTRAVEELKATIKYDPLSAKLATIHVEDGLGLTNQSTTDEARITELLSQAIGKEFIQREAHNLIRSRINKEINNLSDIAKKAGAKTSKKLPVDKKNTATKTRKLESKAPKSTGVTVDGPDKFVLSQMQEVSDWSSLIRILNIKLPQQVAKNMGSPKLNYRTGRFANSTKVVAQETTKEGYPTFVFDYDRDPYDVFDKSLGASPWNTPARDPKTLIAESIRDIVKELAIGRFYTRRA